MLEKPILTGSRVVLRPITPADAPAMFASLDDAESMRLTGTQQTFTLEQVRQHCERVAAADDRVDYAITLPGDPAYIGEVVLNDIDWTNRSAGFRIALAGRPYFGKGYGTEATRLMLAYGFETLALHRIELEVYDFNPRAQHVYEKAGFVREGVRRDALLWDGTFHSAVLMSILAHEYATLAQSMAGSYSLSAYSPDWPAAFAREAARLQALLGGEEEGIHHFGSTSVPGLAAKAIVDLLVTVRDLARIDALTPDLEEAGYQAWGTYGIPGRRYFTRSQDGRRTHNVHFYQRDNPEIERHLAFCAYLRAHDAMRDEYAALKQAIYERYPADMAAYNDAKTDWIRRVEQLALPWYRQRAGY